MSETVSNMSVNRGLCVLALVFMVGVCLVQSREISRSKREVSDLEVAESHHGHKFKKGGGKEHHSDHHSSHGDKGDKGYKGHHHHEKGDGI